MPSKFETRVTSSPDGGVATVTLSGELDEMTAPILSGFWNEVVAQGTRLNVDMAEVTFLNSSGIRALLDGVHHARMVDRQMAITNASPVVRRLLEITGLEHLLEDPNRP